MLTRNLIVLSIVKKRQFKIGQQVSVQNYRGEPRWVPGILIERTGPVSHQIMVRDKVWTEVNLDESYFEKKYS